MYIYGNCRLVECIDQYAVCSLSANPGKLKQPVDIAWHSSPEPVHYYPRYLLYALCLYIVKSDAVYQVLDLVDVCICQLLGCLEPRKELVHRLCGIFIPCPR